MHIVNMNEYTMKLCIYKWFKLWTLGLVVKKGQKGGHGDSSLQAGNETPGTCRVWAAVTLEGRVRLPVGLRTPLSGADAIPP